MLTKFSTDRLLLIVTFGTESVRYVNRNYLSVVQEIK